VNFFSSTLTCHAFERLLMTSYQEAAMTNESSNGRRLTGSQLGYHGKGVPDPETIDAL